MLGEKTYMKFLRLWRRDPKLVHCCMLQAVWALFVLIIIPRGVELITFVIGSFYLQWTIVKRELENEK